ncbi:MAG: hypothetical protein M3R38_10595 [Actinomycetota bacterium]|nr:hypothetical protein [Actinomycetota bacterium]
MAPPKRAVRWAKKLLRTARWALREESESGLGSPPSALGTPRSLRWIR